VEGGKRGIKRGENSLLETVTTIRARVWTDSLALFRFRERP